ncbi:YlxR family protein [Rhodococcus antarcticus]|uniref:YlxR family protein n=1 Tax=Rhodococcus antarcticus TaxID=2987751 RepID=A0ABY6P2R8_9NOCA|nr:YlxR family protein [Rhodococcus antarcticus]UZJ25804.1 YlxR family protein [Rhodococcus antarcticus]
MSTGPERAARAPERTCVGCRVRAPATGLLRVVVQGSSVIPDPRRRLPGRGASVHPTEECVGLAEKRRAFGRALRAPGQLDVSAVRTYVARTRDGLHPDISTPEHSSST